jgi:hypothetical protein
VIASAVTTRVMPETCILDVSDDARGAKGGEKHRSSKLVPRTKVPPSTKKCIIPSIGGLAALSSDGSVESSLNDPSPEVQSSTGTAGALTGCFLIWKILILSYNWCF